MRGTGYLSEFSQASLGYDNGTFFIKGEVIKREHDKTILPSIDSYFGMIGVRMGKWTIHATYAASEEEMEPYHLLMPNQGVPADLVTLHYTVKGLYESLLRDTSGYIVGIRYDMDAPSAIKLEYTDTEDDYFPNLVGSGLRLAWNITF